MTYPDKATTLAKLDEWSMHHAAVERLIDGINYGIGLDPNGPLFATVWALFDAYTDSLAAEIGDLGGWLDWYFAENDMGKRGHEAGYDGKAKKIKNLGSLFWLVELSRERLE